MNRTIYFNKDSKDFLESQAEPWSKVVNKALAKYMKGMNYGNSLVSKAKEEGSIPSIPAKPTHYQENTDWGA